jgi:quinol monooxygenase YgiN
MSLVIVATVTPNPEDRDAVRAALLAAIPVVHDEPGCELYTLHEDEEVFVFVEQWSDRDALKVHMKAPALTALGPLLEGKLAAPTTLRFLTTISGGVKGTLS